MESEQEGWYTDPWGRHEARWMSKGVPTRLVRDGHIESFDDPPDAPPSRAWARIAAPRVGDGGESPEQARLAHEILSPPLTEPGAFGATGAESPGRTITASHEPGKAEPHQAVPVGILSTPWRQPRTLVRLVLAIVFLVVGLVVVDLTRESSGPAQTTTPTTAVRASLAAASGAVGSGCAATPGLAAEFSQAESAEKPVPSAQGRATPGTPLKDVETMIREANHWPQYSAVVNTATTFVEDYIQSAGAQGVSGWSPVTSDLNAVIAQCQLLGQPAG